jgi:hypothetical protein
MRHHTTLRSAALALGIALAGAGGALAAESQKAQKIQITPRLDGARVIALQVWVENLTAATEARYGLAPSSEAIPVRLGDRLRLRLVGTALEADGDGVEIPIQARFAEAPGTTRLDIADRGSNWVVVEIGSRERGRNDDRAQLVFEVTGRYDMRQAMQEGRITFDLGGRGSAPIGTAPVEDRDRLRRSEELAALLYEAILRVDSRAVHLVSGFDEAVDRIYRFGYDGLVQVALDLAREADRRDTYRGARSTAVVGHLYRLLLGRSGGDEELLRGDAGFAGNVRLYERDGIAAVVDTIVRSGEFRDVQDLDRFGLLR